MKLKISLASVLLLVPMLALADPTTAQGWYKEGATEYNLGNFDKAAAAFKKGFELETNDAKKPAYLYNIAQAYRQGNRCRQAVFFYKRFLALKARDLAKPLKASTRAEIEEWIKELDSCAKTQEAIAEHPPQDTIPPGADNGNAGAGNGSAGTTKPANKRVAANNTNNDQSISVTKKVTTGPKLVSAQLVAGPSIVSAGQLDVPVQATFTLVAGYPIPVADKLAIEPGVAATLTPLPFTNSFTGEKQTATLFSVLADVGATYQVAPKIGVRGDVGLGMLVFGGIQQMGNPFTEGDAGTTGPLSMFALRLALSGSYAITPNLLATVTPVAFSFSPPKSGLRSDIKAITRLDFMLGVGYRM